MSFRDLMLSTFVAMLAVGVIILERKVNDDVDAAYKSTIVSLAKAYANNTAAILTHNEIGKSLQQEVKDQNSEIEVLKSENKKLAQQLKKGQKVGKSLQQEVKDQNSEIEVLKSENKELAQQLKKVGKSLQHDVQNQLSEIEILRYKNKKLEQQVQKVEKSLQHDVKDIKSEIEILRDKNKMLEQQFQEDCLDAYNLGNNVSKVYTLNIGGSLIQAYCDMETDGGGWTVFQKRKDGSVEFFLGWEDYAKGFGNPAGEYWIGNSILNKLTSRNSEMRVHLEAFDDTKVYAKYSTFFVGDATTSYKLRIAGYTGTAGNSMASHNNCPFSTKDRDNDRYRKRSCANLYTGAWWYSRCHDSNLNGQYLRGKTTTYANGVVWRTYKEYYYSLKSSTMMVRRQR